MNHVEQSMQTRIKNVIMDYLKDGKLRHVDEIKQEVQRCGIEIEKKSSVIRMALYSLKNENNEISNPQRGFYQYNHFIGESKNVERKSKYNFDEFEVIAANSKKRANMVVSVFSDGTIALNTRLLECLVEKKAEVRLKKDCSELALIYSGRTKINFGKNGRIKNYEIVEKLYNKKIKLPVYYVGEWDEEEHIWVGKMVSENPNIGKKRLNKGK